MSAIAANRWLLFSDAGNGWPHNAPRYHYLVPISCHFRDCKALLVTSLTHVRSAVASTGPFKAFTKQRVRTMASTKHNPITGVGSTGRAPGEVSG